METHDFFMCKGFSIDYDNPNLPCSIYLLFDRIEDGQDCIKHLKGWHDFNVKFLSTEEGKRFCLFNGKTQIYHWDMGAKAFDAFIANNDTSRQISLSHKPNYGNGFTEYIMLDYYSTI